MHKKVYVGLSGGVDSSVTAALLQYQGYDVTGVFMKNWTQDLPGFECPWKEDYRDAKRVAVKLNIPFRVYDFEKQYRQKVVDYMIEGYQKGITPNPDIMCNQEIKFKLFLDTALKDGADYVATGHYARIEKGRLLTARDKIKDQTYFLYRMSPEALHRSIMPIGDYLKPEVRTLALQYGLPTAYKKDSQGICFVGKVGIKDFLLNELGPQPNGPIIDQEHRIVGEHDGAIFYTIGQRHGLNLGGGLPYYVVAKDIAKNIVYVTRDLSSQELWSDHLKLNEVYFNNPAYVQNNQIMVRVRYRAKLIPAQLKLSAKLKGELILKEPVKAPSKGQSAVFYDQKYCLGGGIIV
jgi:tRNA-specific 2-thiouridylase